MNDELLDYRLDEWARYVVANRSVRGLGYSVVSPGFSEFVKNDRAPLVCDDREMEIEMAVSDLTVKDETAAEVLRAEYHANAKYGDARFEDIGNAKQITYRQLGVSQSTYYRKLRFAREFVRRKITKRKAA